MPTRLYYHHYYHNYHYYYYYCYCYLCISKGYSRTGIPIKIYLTTRVEEKKSLNISYHMEAYRHKTWIWTYDYKSLSMKDRMNLLKCLSYLEEHAVKESYRWTNIILVKLIKIILKSIFTFSIFSRITWVTNLAVLDKIFILWLFFNLKLKRITAATKNKMKKEEEKDLLRSSFYCFTVNFMW